MVGPTVGDLDCDGSVDVLASTLRGTMGSVGARRYTLIDGATGSAKRSVSFVGGSHTVAVTASLDVGSCAQALATRGGDGQLGWLDEGLNFNAWRLGGTAGVTPAVAATPQGYRVFVIGCAPASGAPPTPDVPGSAPQNPGPIKVCRIDVAKPNAAPTNRSGYMPSIWNPTTD